MSFEEGEQLWQSFKNGELKAYEQIFNLYYEDLYRYGLKLCSRPELVRDCIQELFVVIWERKDYLSQVQSIKAYLLVSLRRNILKMLEQEKSISGSLYTQYSPVTLIQNPIEVRLIQNELKESQKIDLQEALECLSERQKEILFLKYYNGMSYREIEEILSINYQSIRNHIYRALQKLRAHLKGDVANHHNVIGGLLLILCLPVFG